MKKLSIIFLALILILSTITACNSNTSTTNPNSDIPNTTAEPSQEHPEAFEMEKVGYSSKGDFDYYRDTVTDVIYVRYREYYHGYQMGYGMGGLTVMLDPETGLPLTYTRYMELYENAAATAD